MKKIEYDENMLEEDYINRFLNMIANEYDGGFARQFEKYYILKCKEIERLNNDIKELLKENGNKEKVIKAQDNIIKEVREYIKEHSTTINFKTMRADYNLNMNELLEILDKEVN